jgi:hypothetical protein
VSSVGRLVSGFVLVLLAGGCRYHLGQPAPAVGLAVGEVQAPVAEPAVADALAAALGAAIRREGAAGEALITASVHQASFVPAASRDGRGYAWDAQLGIDFVLLGPSPRRLELRRSVRVSTPAGDAVEPSILRASAFADLAAVLADEAVSSFLYAPAPAPAPPGGSP